MCYLNSPLLLSARSLFYSSWIYSALFQASPHELTRGGGSYSPTICRIILEAFWVFALSLTLARPLMRLTRGINASLKAPGAIILTCPLYARPRAFSAVTQKTL